jgi:4-phytase / acid phosphatase
MKLLRTIIICGLTLGSALAPCVAQTTSDDSTLKFSLVFIRHGVRSPTKANTAYAPYAVDTWPTWEVAPGDLTPHGQQLMTVLGAYYRTYFTGQGILTGVEQQDASNIYFYADNAERTVASAQGLVSGMLPTVGAQIHSVAAGQSDPLFYPVKVNLGSPDFTKAAAALNGRLGSNPGALTTANNLQFALLASTLLNVPLDTAEANPAVTTGGATSVQAIPLTVSVSPGSSIVGFSGSVDTASTLTEIFLLEYADGMPTDQIGWGRLTRDQIAQLTQLHTLDFDLTDRTPYFAQTQGSNLLLHIRNTLNQAAVGIPLGDAIGGPRSKVVMLVGHDDQMASVGGLLHANWQLPQFAWNDTPPGGAMVFELRQGSDGSYFVRLYYLCQTLDQMHDATALSADNPPSIAPIFIPGASGSNATFDAPLADFNKAVDHSINLKFTN